MTRSEFQKIAAENILLLDGATGTELIKRGMPSGVSPELWVYEHPETIKEIHRAYLAAGSNIVLAPTFGGNRCKFAEFGLEKRLHEIVSQLVKISKENVGHNGWVFGDISSSGRFVEPFGELPFDEAVAIFRESAKAMLDGGADGFAIETMMDLQEARAALLGVREAAPDLPVIVTMTFEVSGRSLTGADPVAALNALQHLGADAFGCNCSAGPAEMAEIISKLSPFAKIPLVAKPNAGLPRLENGKTVFPMGPDEFSSYAENLVNAGATILGGCCGTSPYHIARLAEAVEDAPMPEKITPAGGVISSASQYHIISPEREFTIIGERINPTGKKAFQQELREGKTDMAFEFATQQISAGAQVLDINMGLAGINEAEMMRKTLCRLLKTVQVPLCIDSTDPDTVETALKLYPGRALLNSVSAEENRLKKVLPIAAKYGAMLIILPLTDNGIPESAAERMMVADKVIAECKKYGYGISDICVDALVMTVSADMEAANRTLELIKMCTERKINTVCGLSNVSFGLPERALLNRTFLSMAMGQGLNMAIANPLFAELMDMVCAGNALRGKDHKMEKFLLRFADKSQEKIVSETKKQSPAELLTQAVLRGDADGVPGKIDVLINGGATPETIINDILIPAITTVGQKYENKEYFLPQLIAGAEAMQRGTEYLEPMLAKDSGDQQKDRIIIATVKGDIHDIGKNIVAVILRNYGFDVLDLGKDVAAETILDTAEKENIKIIGLSALMTTTMGAMREVVALAEKRNMNVDFIVGGAVVDQLFADELGAKYGADPMSTVRAARELLGK